MKWGISPQTFWPGIQQPLRDCLGAGTCLAILSPDGLGIFIVLVKSITGHRVIYSFWSAPWAPVHLGHNFQCGPLLCPGKYLFICNFLSNSLLHTNKSPLTLPCILCGVTNVLAILLTQTICPKISKCINGGVYCSALLLMQFLQLHMQHMLIMTLHHDIIIYSMISMPECYFRTERSSSVRYSHFQLCMHYLV